MYLIYLDESGNTGNNPADAQQPVFLLCALVVKETCWQSVERDLEESFERNFPALHAANVEVHGADIRSGNNDFRGLPFESRSNFLKEWLLIAEKHELAVVYRAIEKKRYHTWLQSAFSGGVVINPHVAAFALVSRVVNDFLAKNKQLGIFISDENKEIVKDIEKSIKVLRGTDGDLRLGSIIEKGFFIDSKKSRVLQLCDIFAIVLRKYEESLVTKCQIKPYDEEWHKLVLRCVKKGDERHQDVIKWIADQYRST